MLQNARIAYATPATPVRTPRTTEYEIIARITQGLIRAAATREQDLPAFLEALLRNEQMWSTLAEDVAHPDNGLPQPLRAKLFYLYRFTSEHSRMLRQGQGEPAVLIEINTAVLRGLRGEGGTR